MNEPKLVSTTVCPKCGYRLPLRKLPECRDIVTSVRTDLLMKFDEWWRAKGCKSRDEPLCEFIRAKVEEMERNNGKV